MAIEDYETVFIGETKEGDQIILYKCSGGHDDTLHIRLPDNDELWALSPGSFVRVAEGESVDDFLHRKLHVSIESPEWTGNASGYAPRVHL